MATLQERIDTFNSILSNWIITRSDVFYSDEPKDVEVSFMDADGNEVKVTIPNIAKIKSNCADMNLSNVEDSVILNKLKSVDGSGSGLDADKLDGYHLLATVNPDGSFNDDGIFKIKEVNGQKTLFGILDINMYVKSMPVQFDIFGDGSRIALFEFEGNTNDTGGVYNAAWDGAPNYDIGKIGQAAKFDGTSGIKLPSSINSTLSNQIAWTGWVKLTENSSREKTVFNTGAYMVEISFVNTMFRVAYGDNWHWINVKNVNLNEHNFICVNYDKNIGICEVYLNGNKVYSGSNTSSHYFGYPNNVIGIGSRYDGGSSTYPFKGLIDHVSIFNRTLTNEEIQILYNEGR